jgi:hypothetical protein
MRRDSADPARSRAPPYSPEKQRYPSHLTAFFLRDNWRELTPAGGVALQYGQQIQWPFRLPNDVAAFQDGRAADACAAATNKRFLQSCNHFRNEHGVAPSPFCFTETSKEILAALFEFLNSYTEVTR